ncbi:hypothetical protein [Actinoplanes aureus]|uniref:Uncharacterized protein n=1 Tax=Actinoplanes aureus TaxID=2792083 RepID=A0A931C7T3_9ACTN|nr:hypothetical protein [Actinoplanes aureus]MBG0562058.1 hypothetical protein [Actinoplanes aureus]
MTAKTVTVPQQPDIVPGLRRGVSAESPPAGRRLWGHVLRRCVLVPLIVLVPLTAVAARGDHRFNLYWHGGMFRDDPWRIVSHTVASGETYLRLGNFRPLGRMAEKSLDLVAFAGSQLLHLPVNITLRLVTIGAAILLTGSAVLFAESVLTRGRLFAAPPTTVALLLPYGIAAGLVGAGRNSTTTLFGGLYLSTAALVLLVAVAACRLDRLRWWHAVLALSGGGALAIFNEPAYFAVPLATVAALLRGRFVLGQDLRGLLGSAGVRLCALLWAGFLPVFAVVRWIIRGYCADGGCYHGSDLVIDGRGLLVLPARMLAWLPPAQWEAATQKAGSWAWAVLPVTALLLLTVLAVRTRKLLPSATRPPTRPLAGLALAALALLLFGALPAALSVEVHTNLTGRALWTEGWRDSATTAPAGMLLLVVLAVLVTRAGRRSAGLVLAGLVLCATGSAAANHAYAGQSAGWQSSQLDNRIALAMSAFERGPAGDVRRCALLAEVLRVNTGKPFQQQRYTDSLDVAARTIAGVPFCEVVR